MSRKKALKQGEAVIDTMVFACSLLNETEYAYDSLAAISRTETIHVPDSIRAELYQFMFRKRNWY